MIWKINQNNYKFLQYKIYTRVHFSGMCPRDSFLKTAFLLLKKCLK